MHRPSLLGAWLLIVCSLQVHPALHSVGKWSLSFETVIAIKYTFSEMKYKWDVITMFGREDYDIHVCTQPCFPRSTNELRKTIMAAITQQEWAAVQYTYTSFFWREILAFLALLCIATVCSVSVVYAQTLHSERIMCSLQDPPPIFCEESGASLLRA